MKRLLYVLLLGFVGLLTACGSASTTPPGSATTAQPTTAPSTETGLYPAPDLALVASTNRPQFIHSYADW